VTESSDTNNCGACGVVCAAGDTCTSGVCVAPCGAGQTLCGGVCENTQSDPSNCGACGTVCPAGSICDQGACNSNPSPQCAGETCSTFTSCDLDGTCGGSGVCGSTSTGDPLRRPHALPWRQLRLFGRTGLLREFVLRQSGMRADERILRVRRGSDPARDDRSDDRQPRPVTT
jgi:hypothetical protein